MKRWQKIMVCIFCTVAILTIGAILGFKTYLEPVVEEKIEQVAQKVEAVVNDDSIQKQIDDMAQSMIDDGVISVESIPTYNQLKIENEEKRQQELLHKPVKTQKPKVKATPTPTSTPTPTPTPTPAPTPIQKKTLYQKLKEAMTAEEFSFALSIYRRVDVGYAQSLLKTDRAAAKEYIYSRVSPGEISRALEIYAKYSYLLR